AAVCVAWQSLRPNGRFDCSAAGHLRCGASRPVARRPRALPSGTALPERPLPENSAVCGALARAPSRSATMFPRRTLFTVVAMIVAGAVGQSAIAQDKSVTVFAAASMKNAVDDINAAFTRQTGIKAVASYAASSALIKQIENGAPADIFASADLDWMDYGALKKVIKDDTRVNLLGNRLVLIAAKDSRIGDVSIAPGFDLAKLAGNGRIATGDARAVPVGKYAKAALEKLGTWAAVEPKMANVESVRAALALVARGEAVLGIV